MKKETDNFWTKFKILTIVWKLQIENPNEPISQESFALAGE